MSLFETTSKNTYDNEPIVLIDDSGSTGTQMKSGKTIFETLNNTATTLLKKKGITTCKLILWSSRSMVIGDKICVDELYKKTKEHYSGNSTMIVPAMKMISPSWLKTYTDIYVFTDGEISDGDGFALSLKELIKNNMDKKINFHIITVENNNKNYGETQNNTKTKGSSSDDSDDNDDYYTNNKNICTAGNKIYMTIQKNNLTHYLKSFLCYNNIFTNEFYVNLLNPDVPEGYIPFRQNVFKITNTNMFVQYIKSIIGTEDTLKIMHDLTYTIHMITKNKPDKIKNDIIRLFSGLFAGSPEYESFNDALVDGVLAHTVGKAQTFQDYKEKRGKLFERSQQSLYEDVRKSVTRKSVNNRFISYPRLNHIITSNKNAIEDTVFLRNKSYKFGGIYDNYSIVPMFPASVALDEPIRQCVRQYIRAVYSTYHNRESADDVVLYLFLTDVMRICISNTSDEIKTGYKNLAFVMLDRRRFASNLETKEGNIKEIAHLEAGNPPLPVLADFASIENMLKDCAETFGYKLRPYTLWYAIVLALGNDKLILNQYKFCKEDIKLDFPALKNPAQLLSALVSHKFTFSEIIKQSHQEELDYTCFLSLEDTSETGGYKIPEHFIAEIKCDPKYVFSQCGYDAMKLQNSESFQ